MTKHLTKPIRTIHFLVLAFLITTGSQVKAGTHFECFDPNFNAATQNFYVDGNDVYWSSGQSFDPLESFANPSTHHDYLGNGVFHILCTGRQQTHDSSLPHTTHALYNSRPTALPFSIFSSPFLCLFSSTYASILVDDSVIRTIPTADPSCTARKKRTAIARRVNSLHFSPTDRPRMRSSSSSSFSCRYHLGTNGVSMGAPVNCDRIGRNDAFGGWLRWSWCQEDM